MRCDGTASDVVLLNRVARRVRERRFILGMKQRHLAHECGIAASYLCAIEGGQVPKLPVVTLMRLCAVLDIAPNALLCHVDLWFSDLGLPPSCHSG